MPENEKEKEKEPISIIPYSTSVISQAKNYCELMCLPKEAVSSVLRALDNHKKLLEIVKKQQKLTFEEKRLLVDTRTPLAEVPMKMIDDFVEMHMIPYTAMTWIEGKPYPKADGLRYKLQADPRIVKKVIPVRIESPKLIDENNMIVSYLCTVEFWNGEFYQSVGSADLAELQTRRKSSAVSPAFMDMIAETRSVRRATLKALGLPTGVAEEVTEGTEYETASTAETKVAAKTKLEPTPDIPTNLATLLAKAYSEKNMGAQDVQRKLGKSLSDIKDFDEAWKIIKS